MAETPPEGSFGGWEGDVRAKREAWAATTPAERLEWLEESLTFARDVGALSFDRARRAAEARRWTEQYGG